MSDERLPESVERYVADLHSEADCDWTYKDMRCPMCEGLEKLRAAILAYGAERERKGREDEVSAQGAGEMSDRLSEMDKCCPMAGEARLCAGPVKCSWSGHAAARRLRDETLEEAAVAIEILRDNLPWSQGGTVTDSYAKALVLGNLRNAAFTVRALSARQADGD